MELKDIYLVDSIRKSKAIPNIYRDVKINGYSYTLKNGDLLLSFDKDRMLYRNKNRTEILRLISKPIPDEYWLQFVTEYAAARSLPIEKVNIRRKNEI